jgi:hypothetical protein
VLLEGATVQLKVQQKLRNRPECITITTRAERIFFFTHAGGAGDRSQESNEAWIEALKTVPGVLFVQALDGEAAATARAGAGGAGAMPAGPTSPTAGAAAASGAGYTYAVRSPGGGSAAAAAGDRSARLPDDPSFAFSLQRNDSEERSSPTEQESDGTADADTAAAIQASLASYSAEVAAAATSTPAAYRCPPPPPAKTLIVVPRPPGLSPPPSARALLPADSVLTGEADGGDGEAAGAAAASASSTSAPPRAPPPSAAAGGPGGPSALAREPSTIIDARLAAELGVSREVLLVVQGLPEEVQLAWADMLRAVAATRRAAAAGAGSAGPGEGEDAAARELTAATGGVSLRGGAVSGAEQTSSAPAAAAAAAGAAAEAAAAAHASALGACVARLVDTLGSLTLALPRISEAGALREAASAAASAQAGQQRESYEAALAAYERGLDALAAGSAPDSHAVRAAVAEGRAAAKTAGALLDHRIHTAVVAAVRSEREGARADLLAQEARWQAYHASAVAALEGEYEAAAAAEVKEAIDDVMEAERAGRRAVAEVVQAQTLRAASRVATKELTKAVAQVTVAKDAQIAELSARLDAALAGVPFEEWRRQQGLDELDNAAEAVAAAILGAAGSDAEREALRRATLRHLEGLDAEGGSSRGSLADGSGSSSTVSEADDGEDSSDGEGEEEGSVEGDDGDEADGADAESDGRAHAGTYAEGASGSAAPVASSRAAGPAGGSTESAGQSPHSSHSQSPPTGLREECGSEGEEDAGPAPLHSEAAAGGDGLRPPRASTADRRSTLRISGSGATLKLEEQLAQYLAAAGYRRSIVGGGAAAMAAALIGNSRPVSARVSLTGAPKPPDATRPSVFSLSLQSRLGALQEAAEGDAADAVPAGAEGVTASPRAAAAGGNAAGLPALAQDATADSGTAVAAIPSAGEAAIAARPEPADATSPASNTTVPLGAGAYE